jgi:hypothetical protein
MKVTAAIRKNWNFVFLFFWAFSLCGCQNNSPKIEAGYVDLSGWDFRTEHVALDGEWEFYWKTLLTPADFRRRQSLKCDYMPVPGAWKGYDLNQKKLDLYGYATYRVRIKAPPGRYALLTEKIETAFTIWINGRELCSVGVVGQDRQSAQPQYLNAFEFFRIEKDPIEIIIQVSNFRHFQSGIVRSITLGSQKLMHGRVLNRRTFHFSIASTFLIAAMYNLIIFLRRRKNRASLYAAVFCLCFATYFFLLLEHLHIQLFPNLNWEFHFKIIIFTFIYTAIMYLLYLKALFPDDSNRKIVTALWLSTTGIGLIILITPSRVYNTIISVLYLILILSVLYCGHILFNAIKNKQQGAVAQSIPCIAFFITVLNDTLYSSGVIDTTRLAPAGVLFFVIFQFCYMADAFAKSLTRTETLSRNLAKANLKFASLLEECDVEVGKILANLNKIVYIKSNGHFCMIYKNNATKPIELNMQIGKIPTSIRETRFLNVHRSYLMNLNKIQKIVKVADNKYEALIKGTENRVPVSRNKVSGLRKKHPNLFN